MAEIITDPVTGRQRSVEVRYDEGMDSVNPQAVARLFETQKLEDAEKAMSAAIQFQGVRGYQQALKAGEPAEKALTRYGPMMFYQRPSAFGPAVRAVTPPQMTPFQQATIEERKRKAALPPTMTPFQQATIDERIASRKARPIRPPPLTLDQKAEADLANKQFQKSSEELKSTPVRQPGFFRSGNLDEISKLTKERDDARIKLQQLSSGFTPIEAPTASKSPYPEGQKLKGPDGKIYVVKDGVPVLQ